MFLATINDSAVQHFYSLSPDNKNILLLLPFDKIYPPVSGGMQTCFHLIHSLAKKFNVFVVTYQDENILAEGLKKYSTLNNIRIFSINNTIVSTSFFKRLYTSISYRVLKKNFSESADSNFINYYQVVSDLLFSFRIDYLIVQMLSDVKHFPYFKKRSPNTKFIYQSHNVDSELALGDCKKGRISYKKYLIVEFQEVNLYKYTDAVLTVSLSDDQKLQNLNSGKLRSFVIQTGVVIPEKAAISQLNKNCLFKVVFCGSLNYSPNINAINWFVDNCWNTILSNYPDAEFLIIGSGNKGNLSNIQHHNGIKLLGFVDNTWDVYNSSTVSIAPILEGSGIRMKILESMSMGIPVVSTTIGAEGILYKDGDNILIADDPKLFSKKIIHLFSSSELRLELSNNGRELVNKNYHWDTIVGNIEKSFQAISA